MEKTELWNYRCPGQTRDGRSVVIRGIRPDCPQRFSGCQALGGRLGAGDDPIEPRIGGRARIGSRAF